MAGDDAVHDREPQTSPVADPFGREEGLEDAIESRRIHAGAGVRHGQADDRTKLSRACRGLLHGIPPKADRNLADTVAHCLRGVGHQFDDDLMQLTGIAENRWDFAYLLDDLNAGRHTGP